MTALPVFDPNMLEGLLAYGDAAMLRRVVDTFQASTAEVPGQIGALVAASNWKDLAFAAHSLKSGSGVMGLAALADLARGLEDAARTGDGAAARDLADGLSSLYEKSCEALREFVAKIDGGARGAA